MESKNKKQTFFFGTEAKERERKRRREVENKYKIMGVPFSIKYA